MIGTKTLNKQRARMFAVSYQMYCDSIAKNFHAGITNWGKALMNVQTEIGVELIPTEEILYRIELAGQHERS